MVAASANQKIKLEAISYVKFVSIDNIGTKKLLSYMKTVFIKATTNHNKDAKSALPAACQYTCQNKCAATERI